MKRHKAMKKKRIEITVEGSCENCPFCRYDGNYPLPRDSGIDCRHPRGIGRIADDQDIDLWNEGKRELKETLGTLFPESEEYKRHLENHPCAIPGGCPLPDAQEDSPIADLSIPLFELAMNAFEGDVKAIEVWYVGQENTSDEELIRQLENIILNNKQ